MKVKVNIKTKYQTGNKINIGMTKNKREIKQESEKRMSHFSLRSCGVFMESKSTSESKSKRKYRGTTNPFH